jgi:3-oxoacyl-[acyl-carrier-protein] synthase II
MRRVVVTGVGLLTSIGNNVETSWDNLIKCKSGIKKIKHFNVDDLPAKIAGFINNNPNDDSYFNAQSFL